MVLQYKAAEGQILVGWSQSVRGSPTSEQDRAYGDHSRSITMFQRTKDSTNLKSRFLLKGLNE